MASKSSLNKFNNFVEWLKTPEGIADIKAYFDRIEYRDQIKNERFKKLSLYLREHKFDDLMSRLIKENGQEYQDKIFYKEHSEPYPNNKLQFVMDYAKKLGKKKEYVKDITGSGFPEICYYFNGYYFLTINGQGSIDRIYNKNKEMLLQI